MDGTLMLLIPGVRLPFSVCSRYAAVREQVSLNLRLANNLTGTSRQSKALPQKNMKQR